MKKEYDFSNSIKNPYARMLKKQITIRIDEDTILYFKKIAKAQGMPYQSLINSYLSACARKHMQPEMIWK